MANCCPYFLFYSFISGFFIFLVLGIFALTNNPYVLSENLHLGKDDDPTISGSTKKKIYLQYFCAALFDTIFALLIYIFVIMKKEKEKIVSNSNSINLHEEPKLIENINNDNNNINNRINDTPTHSENIISKEGMSENEPFI